MKEIIVFTQKDGDSFLYKEIDYKFQIGDTVYYELTQEDKEKLKDYPHLDCEGEISQKWIDLTDMKILWTVEIDFNWR
jgi:hypothetical protein